MISVISAVQCDKESEGPAYRDYVIFFSGLLPALCSSMAPYYK